MILNFESLLHARFNNGIILTQLYLLLNPPCLHFLTFVFHIHLKLIAQAA